LIPAYRSALS